MDHRFEELLNRARSGGESEYEALLRVIRFDPATDDQAIIEFCRSEEPILRRVAIDLGVDRIEPEVLEAVARLATDDEMSVRETLAKAIVDRQRWANEAVVAVLLDDAEPSIRQLAVKACTERPRLTTQLLRALSDDGDWHVREDAARSLRPHDSRRVARALLTSVCEDTDLDVAQASAETLDHHLLLLYGYPDDLQHPPVERLTIGFDRVGRMPRYQVEKVFAWLEEKCRVSVDLTMMRNFGTVLTEKSQLDNLPRAYGVDNAVESLQAALQGIAPRAAVLLGPSGCGKTAIVYELAHRLAEQGWHMLRVAPADFLTGTVYLGEWQTRLSKLINAVSRPRQVVVYVPNLEELSTVGKSSSTDSNVASALAPYVERGDIVLVGESSEEVFQQGLGANPTLRRLFRQIGVKPMSEQQTRAVLEKVAEEAELEMSPAVLTRVQELADFVNVSAVLPGRVIDLLKQVAGALPDNLRVLSEQDILAALRVATGVPIELLDDAVQLDRVALREFFEARVMGQPEAVDAAVDLVTLIKAGLTDPNKPLGVLLFVGPTGVGKTELARALAEYCFGSASRLTRFDMSEYASYEGFERLIGKTGQPGTLTSAVHEQPFSILLFDEIEKGHFNVFDLCLQIFDAGRLTDGRGQTVDFRRSIVILTSNVGAASVQAAGPMGFHPTETPEPGDSQSQGDLRRFFRPEFLNRIDRIVQFAALSKETAGRIVRREVDRVLERSGIKRRGLTIDLDPSLVPLLLREGYSRHYGARPLKRAIERLVLLPLARAIAAGEVRGGSLVRMLVSNGTVRVQVHQVEESETPEPTLPACPLPADLAVRLVRLQERIAQFRDQATDLSSRKASLLTRTAAADFWETPGESQQVFEQIYVLDGLLARVEGLRKAVGRMAETATDADDGPRARRQEARLDDLESFVNHMALLLSCRDVRQLGDAVVTVTRISGQGPALSAVERIAGMYLKFGRRRHFKVEVLDDHRCQSPPEDSISLLFSGVGAHLLLASEQGLHSLSRGMSGMQSVDGPARELVRVDVALVDSSQPAIPRGELRVSTRALPQVAGRLMRRPRLDVQILHPSSMVSLRAWTDCEEQSALERLMPLIQTRVNHAQGNGSNDSDMLVRRYRLGPSQLVRDARTGRKSGRLRQVFEGHLDAFLVPLPLGECDQPSAAQSDGTS